MPGLVPEDPITLTKALSGVNVIPGDAIYLHGGTYTGDFVTQLAGTAENPITIQPHNNETVIVDGSLAVNGQYTTWKDIIFTYSGWTARDNAPENELKTVEARGKGIKFIGCIIHDTFNNASWQTNQGGGFYECLIYNCGCHRASSNQDEGHAIYTQNEFATQEHHNNILWGQYNYGFHGYTQNGTLYYFDIQNIISFNNGGRDFSLGGLGGQRGANCAIDACCFTDDSPYLKANNTSLTNIYSPGGFTVDAASQNITQSGNTFTSPGSGTNIFVFPRANKSGWAHVAIYNWDSLDSVDLDLSSVTGLGVGDTYKLHNAQDYFTDIVTGQLPANKTLTVDMQAASHSVVARIGSSAVAKTFPTFCAFVVEKV